LESAGFTEQVATGQLRHREVGGKSRAGRLKYGAAGGLYMILEAAVI